VREKGKRGELKRVATALAGTLFATISFAECSQTIPVPQEYKQAQSVVIGTVESARQVPQSWDTLDGTDYVVHIDQKVKGKQSGEITIFSEHGAQDFSLEVGKQYLLFLNNNYQHWQVLACGNSSTLDEAGPVIKQIAHMMGND
jgi:hypothetical protein